MWFLFSKTFLIRFTLFREFNLNYSLYLQIKMYIKKKKVEFKRFKIKLDRHEIFNEVHSIAMIIFYELNTNIS